MARPTEALGNEITHWLQVKPDSFDLLKYSSY